MPELAAIHSTVPLTNAQNVGFAKLEETLLAGSPGRPQRLAGDGWKLLAIAQCDGDRVKVQDGPSCVCAWIGRDPTHGQGPGLASGPFDDPALSGFEYLTATLDGMDPPFAACMIRFSPSTLELVSDPYGLHPLYYAWQSGTVVCCTRLAPILRSGIVSWKLDPVAVLDFFTYEHVTGDRTFADTVRVLGPGTVLSTTPDSVRTRRYSDLTTENDVPERSVCANAHRFYSGLRSATGRLLSSYRRPAVTLSGGLDSRALLACALANDAPVRTYTFGTPACPDVRYAKILSDACGVPNTQVAVDGSHLPRWLDHGVFVTGGMVSCLHYHILALAEVLADEADLVLDGLGGDALTGAHLKWTMALARRSDTAMQVLFRERATAFATSAARAQIFEPDFLCQDTYDPVLAVRRYFDHRRGRPPWVGCHRFDLLERQRRFIQYGPHLLRRFVSVETPFYAREVAGLLTELPLPQLMEQRTYLAMYRRWLRSLARFPDATRSIPVSVPLPLRFTKKVLDFARRRLPAAFHGSLRRTSPLPTNYAEWFRTSLRDFIEQRLLDNRSTFVGIINRASVERLVCEHFEGHHNHTEKIACLLTFFAWAEATQRQGGSV